MPIRQNILRKGKAPKQNLLEFDVFQQETGVLGGQKKKLRSQTLTPKIKIYDGH